MKFLEVKGVGKKLQENWVLKDVSFSVERLQRIAIVGETGSGKSTLIRIVGGWDQSSAGEVLFEGLKVPGTDEKLLPGHPSIAYLSQQYGLPQHLRVEQVLEYANAGTEAEGEQVIAICQVAHLLKRKTSQLSGGEQQRVALCRQLLGKPRLLLLDEPFSNLDRGHKEVIKGVLRQIGEQLSITCILISHDPMDVLSWAGSLLVLKDGQLLQQGTPQEIYYQPANEYVAGLLGRYNLVKAKNAQELRGLFRDDMSYKDIVIRPEQLSFSKEGNGISCEVVAIYFMGSHYEVEVAVGVTHLFVKTEEANFKTGDRLSLCLKGWVWSLA